MSGQMQTKAVRTAWRQTGRGRGAAGGLVALLALVLAGCPDDNLRATLPPGAQVDTFSQASVGKIDVLWVVDNSGSMVQEQENLGRNFERFLSYLIRAKVDYHIGITTTDVEKEAGKLVGSPSFITPETPDPVGAFARNVKVGVTGSGREAGLDAARRTLQLRPEGFLRDDAHLFLIFVSDEDDNSVPGTPKFFFRFFDSLKGKGYESMISAGAIIGDVPGGCINAVTGQARAGTRYKEVVEMVGGRVGSICDDQFDVTLRQMGIDAVGLKRKFQLTRLPDFSTLELTVKLPCDTPSDEVVAMCAATRDHCGGADPVMLCQPRLAFERLGCEVPDEQAAQQCSRFGRFCDGGAGAVLCYGEDSALLDAVDYESTTNSLVFQNAAVPPKGAVIEAIYMEGARK